MRYLPVILLFLSGYLLVNSVYFFLIGMGYSTFHAKMIVNNPVYRSPNVAKYKPIKKHRSYKYMILGSTFLLGGVVLFIFTIQYPGFH